MTEHRRVKARGITTARVDFLKPGNIVLAISCNMLKSETPNIIDAGVYSISG